jgi:hypothetical protein
MFRTLVPLAAVAGLTFVAGPAFAEDSHFNVGQRPEAQLTEPCIQGSLGCRADGYPDARYYRPALEGQRGVVDNYNDQRYYDPKGVPIQVGPEEYLTPKGSIKEVR